MSRNTRYYEKKNDGVFFSKLPKAEQKAADDGRVLRVSEFGGTRYESYGYEVKEVDGLFESAFIDDGEYGIRLMLGLQHEQGVDVLQIKVYDQNGRLTQDAKSFAMRAGNIDLDEPICFGCYCPPKTPDQKFQKCYLTMRKPGGRHGISYESIFPYNEETKQYEGLPDLVEKKVGPRTVYDSTDRDNVLYAELDKFCARVDADPNVQARKASRDATPAEFAKSQPVAAEVEEDEDQVPF